MPSVVLITPNITISHLDHDIYTANRLPYTMFIIHSVVMHAALLLSALGAITTSSPMPRNTTAAILAFTEKSQPVDSPSGRHIPVKKIKCMGDVLNKVNYLGAKQSMFNWSEEGGQMPPGTMHFESHPDNYTGVTWYICNCKVCTKPPVPNLLVSLFRMSKLDDVGHRGLN
ncbi:hypothetical protein F4679DRAFT_390155 [Xylaria curta]|nr:hypothetical protein F4679DRAFT_390155 [Xylaria curta]